METGLTVLDTTMFDNILAILLAQLTSSESVLIYARHAVTSDVEKIPGFFTGLRKTLERSTAFHALKFLSCWNQLGYLRDKSFKVT